MGRVSYTLGKSRAAYKNLMIKQYERDTLEGIGVQGEQY